MSHRNEWLQRLIDDRALAADVASKLAGKLDKSGDCWIYQGTLDHDGYGRIHIGTEKVGPCKWRYGGSMAHRVAYVLAVGELPSGGMVCHSCDNPPCCNPSHLFAGSALVNNQDRDRKGRQAKRQRGDQSGELGHSAKFTAAQARAVVAMTQNGTSMQTICKDLGVTKGFVASVRTGKAWSSVTGISKSNPLEWNRRKGPRPFARKRAA